ncbi:uncharacterized protein LOC134481476 [Rattus norvegicus]|uniref:uncharacterized protein LOC134481476 n=1 Tax=Rattus norvegicus TaxID=10116 RepID=UPI002FD7DBF1
MEVAKVRGPLKAKNTDRGAVSPDLSPLPDWAPKSRAPTPLERLPGLRGEKSELVSSFFVPPKFQTTWLSAHRTDLAERSQNLAERSQNRQNKAERDKIRQTDRCRPAYLPVGGRWSLGGGSPFPANAPNEKLSGRTFPRDGDPLTPKTRPRHHRMQSARGFGLLSGYTGTGTCGRFSHSGDWRAPRNQGWAFIGFWGAEASIQKQMHGYRDIIGGF